MSVSLCVKFGEVFTLRRNDCIPNVFIFSIVNSHISKYKKMQEQLRGELSNPKLVILT